ncbi:MAG: AAA family ATPase [Desulfobacteraceae bacterium]
MQIICISSGGYCDSEELAAELAERTGYPYLSRSNILEEAADFGISVGKIEVEILKKRPVTEALRMEAERYRAFVAARLCEKVLEEGNLIYHGRAGNLVLAGISRILGVRVISDTETAVNNAVSDMNLSWAKAKRYVEDVEEDIKRWVKTLYRQDIENPFLYNLTLNSSDLSVKSAAASIQSLAVLPEFQMGKTEEQAIRDLLLASRCHLELSGNENTKNINIKVSAKNGHVSVSYLPGQASLADNIPVVLERMKDVKSYICTVASTNLVCIGDRFDSSAEEFENMIEIAEKWNAAIDLVRIAPSAERVDSGPDMAEKISEISTENGGILEESDSSPSFTSNDSYGVEKAMDRLIKVGRAGTSHTVGGGEKNAADYISRTGDYSLVVVGDVFSSKDVSRARLKRDYINLLSDKFKVPVIAAEELKSHYLFGKMQMVSLFLTGFLSLLIYLGVFKFQEPILRFISAGQTGGDIKSKVFVSIVIAVAVPIIAFTIGGFYSNVLKLIRLE